jgi:hypothetical protein
MNIKEWRSSMGAKTQKQSPISAKSIPAQMGKTIYPKPYVAFVKGRLKQKLGDRTAGDEVTYPHDDLKAIASTNSEWTLTHQDGRPYEMQP